MSTLLNFNRILNKCYNCGALIQKRLQQIQCQVSTEKSESHFAFRNATQFANKHAIKDNFGNYTYGNIIISANDLSNEILKHTEGRANERIAFLCPNDVTYVITQWAIWLSGQIAVPLNYNQPTSLLQYYCEDSDAKLLITTLQHAEKVHIVAKKVNKKLLVLDDKLQQISATRKIPKRLDNLKVGLPTEFYYQNNAMILYTSGTTGRPKGVVLTHKNLQTQIASLIEAWKWNSTDVILHCLPLNHTHGIVNALMCPLAVGAKCIMMPKFDKDMTWSHLLAINRSNADRITVFMAVPTMYALLIKEYERLFTKNHRVVDYIKNTLKSRVRLMVSGSAPLPVPLFNKWEEITGHKLLERYGMTEIGMCLSNDYNSLREPGYVGVPLPGVTIKLATCNNDGTYESVLECSNDKHNQIYLKRNPKCNRLDLTGEILVKSDTVFKEYFNNIAETKKAFTSDGWFKTGDIASFNMNKRIFKLLGRTKVDIIKTAGFKVSALEIEVHLLSNPDIEDCAVVGIDDLTWGQKVAALVVLKPNTTMNIDSLRSFAKTKMPEYAVPTIVKFVGSIPKNVMGKVNKADFVKQHFSPKQ